MLNPYDTQDHPIKTMSFSTLEACRNPAGLLSILEGTAVEDHLEPLIDLHLSFSQYFDLMHKNVFKRRAKHLGNKSEEFL